MFHKYPSLESKLSKEYYSRSEEDGWALTEKIHGANFQVIVGGVTVNFAGRRFALDEFTRKSYFKTQELEPLLSLHALNLSLKLKACKLNVYGELYGGNIQKEIIYQNKHRFIVFDVLINGTTWLSYDKFDLVTEAGFDIVPIKIGILKDLLKTDVEFKSSFSSDHAEGYVIKKVIGNGSNRLAFKNKSPAFIEKHMKKKVTKKVFDMDKYIPIKDQETLRETLRGYVLNENRVTSWYSKGNLDNAFPKVAQGVIKDAINDYMKDFPESNKKTVTKLAFTMFIDLVVMIKNRN
jgi:Rnl2 family RNA ligase